jgi:hypothetical protein
MASSRGVQASLPKGTVNPNTKETEDNVALEPVAGDGLGLAVAEEYRKRFESAQSSISRSLLVLLGLIAFWLAIENSYSTFLEIAQAHASLRLADARFQKLLAKKNAELALIARSIAAGTGEDTRKPASIEQRYQPLVDSAQSKSNELRDKISKLKHEAVDLSIVGTKLPSQLSYAPTIWLATLLGWLLFFEAKRTIAHSNLAAYRLTLARSDPIFGAAVEGGIWLSPLPAQIDLPSRANRIPVSHDDLLWTLGITRRVEIRQHLLLVLVAIGIALVVLRNGYIAYDMCGDFALEQGFTPRGWQLPGTVISVFLSLVCLGRLARLVFPFGPSRHPRETAVLSRREILGGIASATIAGALWRYRGSFSATSTGALSGTLLGQGRPNPHSPRFRKLEIKARRKANAHVLVTVPNAVALMFSNRQRQSGPHKRGRREVTLHFANRDHVVRFFSAARTARHLSALPLETAEKWVDLSSQRRARSFRQAPSAGPTELPLNAARTSALEQMAIARVEAGDMEGACRFLLVGARLTLQSQTPNLRLLDLLAGLAVRSAGSQRFLQALIGLTEARTTRLRRPAGQGVKIAAKERGLLLLETRVHKWRDQGSSWFRRWSNAARPVWWHHPAETRPFESTRIQQGKDSRRIPTMRQRPIKIS